LGAIVGTVAVLAAAFGLYVTAAPPVAVNHDLGAVLIGVAAGLGGPKLLDVLTPMPRQT
jgi:hypothetical protein